jgi:hypothetical protein
MMVLLKAVVTSNERSTLIYNSTEPNLRHTISHSVFKVPGLSTQSDRVYVHMRGWLKSMHVA